MNTLEKLADLHKQATEERSHYYTGSVIKEAADTIARLEAELSATELDRDMWKQSSGLKLEVIKRLEAENAGLRELLDAADMRGAYPDCNCSECIWARKVQAALSNSRDETKR